MRNRLQVSFWGLHIDAVGIVAIGPPILTLVAFRLLNGETIGNGQRKAIAASTAASACRIIGGCVPEAD